MRDQNINFDKNFSELKRNIYSLYVLYKDVKESSGFNLPDFIDRGKSYTHLINMGFAEGISSKKHIHDTPYSITSPGKSFINNLEENFDCNSIFTNVPLDNKIDFDQFFKEVFKERSNYQSLDENISLCIKAPIGETRVRNNVELTFLGCRKLDDDGKIFKYIFGFKTFCIRCKQEFKFEQEVKLDSENYCPKPSYFNSGCPRCRLEIHIDVYITNWWFDDK